MQPSWPQTTTKQLTASDEWLNMPNAVSVIQCENCGAPLTFHPGEQVVACQYCGYTLTVPMTSPLAIPALSQPSSEIVRTGSSAWDRPSGKIGLITVFTALALGTNYAMIGIPNVKVMDALVFVAAFLFGLRVGTGVAILTWSVYGTINPYGLANPILLGFLMLGESFYALGGAALRRTEMAKALLTFGDLLLFALVGFFTTFAYDVLTNFASYLFLTPTLLRALLIGMVTGAPFAIIHEVSNIFFFITVVPLAILAARPFYRSIV